MLNSYIHQVRKRYKEKDKQTLEEKNHENNRDNKSIKASKEVILLTHYKWVLLKNDDDIEPTHKSRYHSLLGMYLDTYKISKMFFELDKNFKPLHELKEKYITFNQTNFKSAEEANKELQSLINLYKASDQSIFKEFAYFLVKFQTEIINSFTYTKVYRKSKEDQYALHSRLSNGPMEGFNRKPKDLKRNSRGLSNFDFTRNSILWSTRKNPSILGTPKSKNQIHSYKGKPRGKYKNNKSKE